MCDVTRLRDLVYGFERYTQRERERDTRKTGGIVGEVTRRAHRNRRSTIRRSDPFVISLRRNGRKKVPSIRTIGLWLNSKRNRARIYPRLKTTWRKATPPIVSFILVGDRTVREAVAPAHLTCCTFMRSVSMIASSPPALTNANRCSSSTYTCKITYVLPARDNR